MPNTYTSSFWNSGSGELSGSALLEIREGETGVFENFYEKIDWQVACMDGYGSSIQSWDFAGKDENHLPLLDKSFALEKPDA